VVTKKAYVLQYNFSFSLSLLFYQRINLLTDIYFFLDLPNGWRTKDLDKKRGDADLCIWVCSIYFWISYCCASSENAKVQSFTPTWHAHLIRLIQFTVSLECFSLSRSLHVGDFDSSFLRRKCVGRAHTKTKTISSNWLHPQMSTRVNVITTWFSLYRVRLFKKIKHIDTKLQRVYIWHNSRINFAILIDIPPIWDLLFSFLETKLKKKNREWE